jgi:Cupin-like domain
MTKDIKQIHKASRQEFSIISNAFTTPIIIKDGAEDWPALSSWTFDSLKSKFGNTVVNAAWSSDGIFRGDPVTGFSSSIRKIRFDRFIDLISAKLDLGLGGKYYLQQTQLTGPFSTLTQDIIIPRYIEKELLKTINLWLGPDGNISPLHYDRADNLLCQVIGAKKIVLFSPSQTSYLYPFPESSRIPHMAQVDIDQPDLEIYPDFQLAVFMEATILPGDILFIPKHWWHQVYSLSAGISINFWHSANSKPGIGSYLLKD